jgi:hypothetical protein
MTEEHYTKYTYGLDHHTDPVWKHDDYYYTHPDGSVISRDPKTGMWWLIRNGTVIDINKYRHDLMEKYFSAP